MNSLANTLINYRQTVKTSFEALFSSQLCGIVCWLGKSVANVGYMQGCLYGAVAGSVAAVALPIIQKQVGHQAVACAMAAAVGTAAGYAVSYIAGPLSTPGLLLCSMTLIARNHFIPQVNTREVFLNVSALILTIIEIPTVFTNSKSMLLESNERPYSCASCQAKRPDNGTEPNVGESSQLDQILEDALNEVEPNNINDDLD